MLNITEICVVFFILGLYSATVKAPNPPGWGVDDASDPKLDEGKRLAKGILQTIHSILQDGQNYDAIIDAATILPDLVRKTNAAVSSAQVDQLKALPDNQRNTLKEQLRTFHTSFYQTNEALPLSDLAIQLNQIASSSGSRARR